MGLIDPVAQAPTPRIMQSSLSRVASSYSFRCDAKQSEARFERFDAWISNIPHYRLNDVLPGPVVKGCQPTYSDDPAAPYSVITTMAIQNLRIELSGCRSAQEIDFGPENIRKPRIGDVLLTVDGGTSIGKPVLFDLLGDYAVDSHVAILRPDGIEPETLVYLLASPLGQLQLQRAESGSSGQTSVTEDDIRRFRFPYMAADVEKQAIAEVIEFREEAKKLREQAVAHEMSGWVRFLASCAPDWQSEP